jgi:hypothetical protein
MLSDEIKRMPGIGGQGDGVTAASSATSPADDPDADLKMLPDEDLRREIDALKASKERPAATTVRLLRAIGILVDRGLARPRGARRSLADVPAARPDRSRAVARRRFLALVRRVTPESSPACAEALAEFLAIDFVDSRSIGKFRTIARGLREGIVDPRTVRAAYKAARKPGVERPGALFTWYVLDRSPGLARARAAARR